MSDSPSVIPGVALTALIAVAAMYLHALPFVPFTVGSSHPIDALLVAILLGMALRNLFDIGARLTPGIKYAVNTLLPVAIVLIGAKLDFFDVLRISGKALALSVLCVSLALVLTLAVCRKIGVGQKLGLLIAIGTAICGGTAITVAAPIIEAEERDTAFAIMTITVFGVLAIFLFPPLGWALALSQTEFGVWAGISIHATPQVMAAGFAYGQAAGDVATIVKLVRVLLLAPIVIGLGAWYAQKKRKERQAHVAAPTKLTVLFPPFILGFLALAVARTLHLLPDFTLRLQKSFLWAAGDVPVSMAAAVTSVSGFLVVMAMAGVGLGVHVKTLRKVGLAPLYAGLIAALILAALALILLKLWL